MKKSQLTIVIPTINRLAYLKVLLNEILPLADFLNFNICVSSNCCTDSTDLYLKRSENSFKRLKVFYHEELLSIDENMIFAISMAETDYVLPLGDDDFLSEEYIRSILGVINTSDHDLILLNCLHTDAFLNPVREHLPETIAGKSFSNPVPAFEALWCYMPFGSFLAKKECFNLNYSARFFGTSHAYTGVVWESLMFKFDEEHVVSVYCMSKPTVLLRGAIKTWESNRAYIMLHEIPLWFNILATNLAYRDVVFKVLNVYISGLKRTKFLINLYFYSKDFYLIDKMPIIQSSFYDKIRIGFFSFLPRKLMLRFLDNIRRMKRWI